MYDNSIPYAIRTENKDGSTHYIVMFHDGQNIFQEMEMFVEIAEVLNDLFDENETYNDGMKCIWSNFYHPIKCYINELEVPLENRRKLFYERNW